MRWMIVFSIVAVLCGLTLDCVVAPKVRTPTARPAIPAATTQPALPYWFYLRLMYPHRTTEDPEAAPRDFEQQALRRLHLFRPDLIPYPIAIEVYA